MYLFWGEIMLDLLIDALLDTLKLLPYLLITFLILEFIEHKLSEKNQKLLIKNKKYGPFIGGILGALPQCGFSSMAASLFSSRVITIGTVVAVFLSTSDEMIPIMIGEHASILLLLKIVGFKTVIGIFAGIIIDIIFNKKVKNLSENISLMCEEENCSCDEDGVILSSIKHTLKIGLFILIANLLISFVINKIGVDNLSNILVNENILTYFLASILGLIPNCASSVIMTKLYLSELISMGVLLSGLLTGSGIGILLLFRENKNIKENIFILSIVYLVGVFVGILVDLIV